MLDIKIDTRGIITAFKDLPKEIRKEMLDKAVKAGAQVVKKGTLKRVPRGKSGNLRKSLKVRSLKSREPMLAAYQVAFSQRGADKGHHAHLIEEGHFIWRRKKRGRGSVAATGKKYEMENTGKRTRKTPMLKVAFFTGKTKAIRAIQSKLSVTEMEKLILKKLRSRARVVARR